MEPGFFQITLKAFIIRTGPGGEEFLVLRDAQLGIGDLPGGRISQPEFYKPWSDCLRREIAEELGTNIEYDLTEESIFLFPHRILSARTDGLGVAHIARYLGGEIQLSEEHDHYNWVNLKTYDPHGFFVEHMEGAVLRFQQEYMNRER